MYTDNQLIDAVLDGDQSLFADLVNKYQRMAFNVANRILWDREEAEEAAMDAFVKAYKGLKKFDRRSKFSTWLYRIASNEALGRARKKKVDKVDISSAMDIGTSDVTTTENAELIGAGLKALNEKDRELLTLFYLNELSLDEMGDMLEIETNTIKVSVHRARKRLATKMHEMIGDEVYELVKN